MIVTPNVDSTTPVIVNVATGKFTDTVGNNNIAATQNNQAVDTVSPTVLITDDQTATDGTITYTFTLSKASTNFSIDAITVLNGTKGTFTAISSTSYTLVVIPDANSPAPLTVEVAAGKFTDTIGNGNIAARDNGLYSIVIHEDGSQTETYVTDNNGHQTTTIYEYNAAGEQISLSEDDRLMWVDDLNVSHIKETLHTLITNADGTQTEAYFTNDDEQKTSLTYLYDNTGAILSIVEVQADGSQIETYTTDDNSGHQTTTIYEYNAAGEQISLSEDNNLVWLDDLDVAHFTDTLYTLITNIDGTQTEAYLTNEDGQKTSLTYLSDGIGTILNVIEVYADGSQTETYTTDDNNGHQTTTVYKYNTADEQISLSEADNLIWLDDSNVTHFKDTLHTLITNADGIQTEAYLTNEDGQTTSLTYSYDNMGSLENSVEIQADGFQTETYLTDDNNGHQTTTVYDYNSAGEQISLSEADNLVWLDDSNVTHFKDSLHTLTTNADGTQTEVYSINEDGQKTLLTYQYDSAGNIISFEEIYPDSQDIIPPTITITNDQVTTSNSDITYTFTLSEASTNFVADDITVSGGTKGTFTAISPTSYTLVVTPNVNSITPVTVDVVAGKFTDLAENNNVAATQNSQAIDTISPVVVITDDQATTTSSTVTYTFTLSEASTNFVVNDITVSGGTKGIFTAISPTCYILTVTTPGTVVNVSVETGKFTDATGNNNI